MADNLLASHKCNNERLTDTTDTTNNIFASICDPLGIILNYLPRKQLLSYRLIDRFFNNYICNANMINKIVIRIKNKNIKFLKKLNIKRIFYNIELDKTSSIYDIRELTNLYSLHIPYDTKLTENHHLISSFTSLKHLIIGEFNILNDDVKLLTNLKTLNLEYNKTITQEGLCNLTRLRKLNLESNQHIIDLQKMSNLQWLNIRWSPIIRDNGIQTLTNLTHLDLFKNNNITDNGIRALTNLKTLNLSTNKSITDIGIQNLTNITNLDLFDNKNISNKGIQHLMQLSALDIGHNYLITNISHFTNLRNLDLCCNHSIGPEQLKQLKLIKLSLRENNMFADEDIAKLTSVKSLSLCYNTSRKLTNNGLCKMTQLTHLDLWGSSNKITHEGLNHLTNLKTLICNTENNTDKLNIPGCKIK